MKAILSIFLLFTANTLFAQLVTNTSQTPSQLVQNVLLGGGVTASGISYTGAGNAIGYFNGGGCNIGLGSGIILTTGTVLNVPGEGPHGPNNTGSAGQDNLAAGDPFLQAVSGTGDPSYNATILEFDFIPVSDSISFKFVFASEEYLEFVNAGFNDVFGFFISGPNPSGGNYTNSNIALIPGTSTPVTIDNLNNMAYSQYYVDNGDGYSAPQNGSPFYVQYDGFTTPLLAKAHVVCGQTYHIKIAISDIGDEYYDSGVFLQEGSFTSPNPLSINTNIINSNGGNGMYEGCSQTTVTYTRVDSINFTQTFPITISGTATNGVDYTNIPNQITFAAGQATTQLVFDAFFDGITEGTETINIDITIPLPCGPPFTNTLSLQILDVDTIGLSIPNATIYCPSDTAELTPTVSGGKPPYSYLWSNGATTTTIKVHPGSTTSYSLTVTDDCGSTKTATAQVTVPTYQPLTLDLGPDLTVYCPNTPVNLNAIYNGGAPNYHITWNTGQTSNGITVSPFSTTTYYATINDSCGASITDSITVNVTLIPLTVEISNTTLICPSDSILIYATGHGGSGGFTYLWNTGQTDSAIWVKPNSDTYYTVHVGDQCGTYTIPDSVLIQVAKVNAGISILSFNTEVNKPIYFGNTSTGASTYFWDLGNGETSTQFNASSIYSPIGNYQVMLVATNQIGCSDTAYIDFYVRPEFNFYAPNAFTPNDDGKNDYFFGKGTSVKEYQMRIFDRWGKIVYETTDPFGKWDGKINGYNAKSDVYVYQFILVDYNRQKHKFLGHVTLLR